MSTLEYCGLNSKVCKGLGPWVVVHDPTEGDDEEMERFSNNLSRVLEGVDSFGIG